jgi:hypothetical protein
VRATGGKPPLSAAWAGADARCPFRWPRCKAAEITCFAAAPGGASCVRPPALNRPGSRQRSDFLTGSTSFSKGRFSTTPPTPRRRSVLHGPRRLRLTAALKIDDAVVMCGLEDRSGRVDAFEDRGQSPPRRLGAEPRDHLCGAVNIGQIGALDRLTPGLTRPRMRVAGFGEVKPFASVSVIVSARDSNQFAIDLSFGAAMRQED